MRTYAVQLYIWAFFVVEALFIVLCNMIFLAPFYNMVGYNSGFEPFFK